MSFPNRRSIRLKNYDYSQNGAYFITINTRHFEHRFGQVVDNQMHLNKAGEMVQRWWLELAHKFDHCALDAFVVMPNHFHGIMVIDWEKGTHIGVPVRSQQNTGKNVGAELCLRPEMENDKWGTHIGVPVRSQQNTEKNVGAKKLCLCPKKEKIADIPQMVQWFKTMTTNEYIRGVKSGIFAPFGKKLWHRNYYEHVIRNEKSWETIRHYIHINPAQWEKDCYYLPTA